MKKIILILVLLIFIIGCAEKECKTDVDCLAKTCFTVQCTDNKCVYSSISNCCGNEICEVGETYLDCVADCPNCDDKNNCTVDEYDYHEQKCVNIPIFDVVCCGNTICEIGETYETCTRDCPNCDDKNECTKDSYDYHEQKCINELIIPCCGNGICDKGVETYLNCLTDCPNCDDNNKLTGDSFSYTTQKCEYVTYYLFDDFDEGSASWNLLDPRWSIVFPEDETNGMLTAKVDDHPAFTSFGDRSWTDYTFRLKVKLEQGGVELSVRAKFGEEGAYAVYISENQLTLSKDVEPRIKFEDKKYPFGLNQFHDIKIEVKDKNIKVYIDEKLQIGYTDTNNPILAGNVALYSSDKAYFDEIIVEAL